MKATRRTGGVLLVGAMAVASACGDSGESSLEQLIESETGDDVDIDLDNDGGFSIESDEGSFTVDEEGNFVAVGEDGEVVTGNVDVGDDSIIVQSDDGQVVIEGDGETGSVEITGDDGDVTFSSGEGIPDEWPAEVPQPTGLDIVGGSTFADGGSTGYTVIGMTSTSPVDYLGSYGPMLEAAGFAQTTFFESEGNVSAFYEGTAWVVTFAGAVDPSGDNTVTIAVNTTE